MPKVNPMWGGKIKMDRSEIVSRRLIMEKWRKPIRHIVRATWDQRIHTKWGRIVRKSHAAEREE
jgi:hypothetical protein